MVSPIKINKTHEMWNAPTLAAWRQYPIEALEYFLLGFNPHDKADGGRNTLERATPEQCVFLTSKWKELSGQAVRQLWLVQQLLARLQRNVDTIPSAQPTTRHAASAAL